MHLQPLTQTVRSFRPAALLFVLLLAGASASGAIYNWDVDGAGNWNVPGNWSPNTGYPDAVGDVANFVLPITDNRTVTQNVGAGVTVGELHFVGSGGNNWTLNSNSLRLESPGGVAQITSATSSGRTQIGTALVLASDLVADVTGELRFSGITETGGPRSVTKTGAGLLSMGGNWAFTGTLNINGGTLGIGEPGNTISAAERINVTTATLNMGSVRRASPNRLPDTATVALSNGAFVHNGDGNGSNGSVNNREEFGDFVLASGMNRVQVVYASGTNDFRQANEISAARLIRENRATALVRGNDLGSTNPGGTLQGASRIFFRDSQPTPALVGGAGAAGTTTVSILPYLIGGTSSTLANTFVTYDPTVINTELGLNDLGAPGTMTAGRVGLRPLNISSEFASALTGAVLDTNVRRTSNETLAAAAIANSLILVGNTTIAANAGLTLQSGALLYNGAFNQVGTITGDTLDASGRELVIHVVNTNTSGTQANQTALRLDLVIQNADGLTYGDFTLGGNNDRRLILTQQNTYGGPTTINSGLLEVTASGSLGVGDVVVRNRGTLATTNSQTIADSATVTIDEGGLMDLNFVGLDTIYDIYLGGVYYNQFGATFGTLGSGATFESDFFAGSGFLVLAIPEPASGLLLAFAGLCARRRRR